MKTTIVAIITALALSACTTTEMVTIAQNECAQIGYAVGTAQHTECTERGYRGVKAQQDAAVTNLAWWAILEAAY